jgi:hypothetical protein
MVSVDLALDPDELARERRRMAASDSEDGSEFEIDMGRQERIEPDEEISDETDAEEEYEQYIDQADQADQPSPSAGFSAASQTLSSKRKGKLRAIEPDLDLDEGDLEVRGPAHLPITLPDVRTDGPGLRVRFESRQSCRPSDARAAASLGFFSPAMTTLAPSHPLSRASAPNGTSLLRMSLPRSTSRGPRAGARRRGCVNCYALTSLS